MPEKEIILSPEGLRKLESELDYLKTVKRREVAQRIKEAREFGRIDENPEYENAKNEQAFVEGRIASLEQMLRNARLVDDEDIDPQRVGLGSKVALLDVDQGTRIEYTIVGTVEADPSENRISYLSPVAQALMGREVGSEVEVKAPGGTSRYRILEITR